jgi:hypothetical protein
MDFKGHFALGDGARCHPFTLTDEASRMLLCCQGAHAETDDVVRPLLEKAFVTYGLPWFLRSDNGCPFATHTVGGISRLVIWLVQLGVTPVRIEPGQPQQNGKHERMHLTLKTDVLVCGCMDTQQDAFDSFRGVFNTERPHDALAGATPSDKYRPSARMPGALKEPSYDDSFDVRQVSPKGTFVWKGHKLHAGKLLARRPVGVRHADDGVAEVRYGPLTLGYFDEAEPSSQLLASMPERTFESWAWCI